jgi:plasmid stabilization system protein ParE
MSFLGRVVPEFENPNLREMILKNYRIVYRIIDKDKIEILSVIHSVQDMANFNNLEKK